MSGELIDVQTEKTIERVDARGALVVEFEDIVEEGCTEEIAGGHVLSALLRARGTVREPDAWGQLHYWHGLVGSSKRPPHESGASAPCCLVGHLRDATIDVAKRGPYSAGHLYYHVVRTLAAALELQAPDDTWAGDEPLTAWNDEEGRELAEVVAALERAAAAEIKRLGNGSPLLGSWT